MIGKFFCHLETAVSCRHPEDHHGQKRRRKHDLKVLPELILHLASLGLYCRDRGVRDHGQIVAKHGAADHGSDADSHGKSCLFTDPCSDRRQSRDRPHGSSHGHGDKAADHKKAHHRDMGRQNRQAQIDRTVHAARSGNRPGKCSGAQEDQTHCDNIFIAHASGDDPDLFLESQFPVL